MLVLNPDCIAMQAEKVVVFHSKYRSIVKEEEVVSTVPYYTELASADFDIEGLNETLKAKFEETQALIKTRLA